MDAGRRVFSPGAVAVRGHTLAAVGPGNGGHAAGACGPHHRRRRGGGAPRVHRRAQPRRGSGLPGRLRQRLRRSGERRQLRRLEGRRHRRGRGGGHDADRAAAPARGLHRRGGGGHRLRHAGRGGGGRSRRHPHQPRRPLPVGRRRGHAPPRLAGEPGALRALARGLQALHRGARLRAPPQRRPGRTAARVRVPLRPRHRQRRAGAPGRRARAGARRGAPPARSLRAGVHAGRDRTARAFPHRAPRLPRRAPRRLHPGAHEHPHRRGRRHRLRARMLGGVVPHPPSRDGARRHGSSAGCRSSCAAAST